MHRRVFFIAIFILLILTTARVTAQGITPPIPHLVKDINVGTGDSWPRDNMIEYNGRAYFINSPSSNLELWSTDGSETGTQRIYQFQFDPNYYTSQFEVANSLLFIFLRNTGDGAVTVYQTNGTLEGTNYVTNFYNSNTFGEHPLRPIGFNNFLYYVSTSYLSDSQFIRTNGSTEGTQVLKKFTGNVSYKGPFLLNNRIYLLVWTNNKTALELWQSDGTPSGTVLIKTMDHPPVSFNYQLVSAGNKTFFIGSDSLHGDELWETDGTAAGTQIVSDLTPGSGSSQFYPLNLFNIFSTPWNVTKDTLYFVTSHDQTTTLWKTQGGNSGVQKVLERPNIVLQGSSNNQVYFSIADDPNAPTMWSSDGTQAGTRELFTIGQQWVSVVFVGDLIFYSNTDAVYGQEVWVYNGTTGQANIIGDINPIVNGYTGLHPMSFANSKLWISGFDGSHGDELWVYDFLTNRVCLPVIQK